MKTKYTLKKDRNLPISMVSSDVTDYMESGERVAVSKNEVFELDKIKDGVATLSNNYFMIFVPENWIKQITNQLN